MSNDLGKDYYNDNAIAGSDNYNTQLWSTNFEDGTIKGKVGKLDGYDKLAEAKISNECDAEFNICFSASSGKGKIVLVMPESHVKVLKEVDCKGEATYEGIVKIHLSPGEYKVKIVGDGYSGEFKIRESKNLFQFSVETVCNKEDGKMFDDFPFENRKEF